MCAFEIKVLDEAAGIGAWPKMVVQRRVRTATNRNRFHVAADAAVDEHRLTLDFATIKAEKAVFGVVLRTLFFAM